MLNVVFGFAAEIILIPLLYTAYVLGTTKVPLIAFMFGIVAVLFFSAGIFVDFLFGWSPSAESFVYLLNSVLILEMNAESKNSTYLSKHSLHLLVFKFA